MEVLGQVWPRAIAVDAPLPAAASMLVAALALGLVLVAWTRVRMLTTVCHEAGHAVVALVTGRRLSGIRVHADTSGLTLTRGRGPGTVAMLFAGYPAPSLVGLGVAALAGSGHSSAALWLIVALLGVMLLAMRNVHGALVVLGTGVLIGAVSWFAPASVLTWVAHGLAWLLLLAGPRPVLELVGDRGERSDAAQLAAITRVPRLVWIGLWLVLCAAGLLGGGWLMLSGARG